MAPPKKPEANKSKKINFTLSPAMFEAFKQKCLDEGKEISKTLQALIEMFLNNQIPDPVIAPSIGESDLSLIQSLQARIEKLEQEKERAIDTHSINIESIQNESVMTSTQKPAIDVSQVTLIEASPEPVKVNTVKGKVTSDEVKIIGEGIYAFQKKSGMKGNKNLGVYFGGDVSHKSEWIEGNASKAPGRDRYNMIVSKLQEAGILL